MCVHRPAASTANGQRANPGHSHASASQSSWKSSSWNAPHSGSLRVWCLRQNSQGGAVELGSVPGRLRWLRLRLREFSPPRRAQPTARREQRRAPLGSLPLASPRPCGAKVCRDLAGNWRLRREKSAAANQCMQTEEERRGAS